MASKELLNCVQLIGFLFHFSSFSLPQQAAVHVFLEGDQSGFQGACGTALGAGWHPPTSQPLLLCLLEHFNVLKKLFWILPNNNSSHVGMKNGLPLNATKTVGFLSI